MVAPAPVIYGVGGVAEMVNVPLLLGLALGRKAESKIWPSGRAGVSVIKSGVTAPVV